VLRRIFGPRREEVTGPSFVLVANIIKVTTSKRTGGTGHAAHMGREENVQSLGGGPEGERPLGRE
jgi:hypothetical protein